MSGPPSGIRASRGKLGAYLDLVVVCSWLVTTTLVGSLAGGAGPLAAVRVVTGVALVFFLPGYALVALLFPASRPDGESGAAAVRGGAVSPLEIVVLSVGLSIAAVPLVALLLGFTTWGITQQSVLGALNVLVVATVTVTAIRRARLPADQRFHLDYSAVSERLRGFGTGSGASPNSPVNLVVVVLVLVSVGFAGAALAGATNGEQYTEFYLLSANADGELVADDYPATLSDDQPTTLHVGIGNREGVTTNYTVVVLLQEFETAGGDSTVADSTVLDRFETRLEAGETDVTPRSIQADQSLTGDRLRLTFLLYTGSPPADPDPSAAYRQTHIWVEVPPS